MILLVTILLVIMICIGTTMAEKIKKEESIVSCVIGIGVVLILVFFAGNSIVEGFGIAAGIFGLLFVATQFKEPRKKKEQVSKNVYERMLLYRECTALLENRDKYMQMLKGNSEYFALEEFYNIFPKIYQEYSREVLNQPLELSRPISPYTAAMLGTQIGGVAVGVVAAQNAIEKQKTYEKNKVDVIRSQIKVGNALDKLTYCHASVIEILKTSEETKSDWENRKFEIEKEMKERYIV